MLSRETAPSKEAHQKENIIKKENLILLIVLYKSNYTTKLRVQVFIHLSTIDVSTIPSVLISNPKFMGRKNFLRTIRLQARRRKKYREIEPE